MKKCLLLLIILTTILNFSGCRFIHDHYEFDQSIENVQAVQICRHHYGTETVTPIVQLEKDDYENLLTDIQSLEWYRYFNDPRTYCGEIVVQIVYCDGTGEIIGSPNSARVDENGEWHLGMKYYTSEDWEKLIYKYVDPNLVPELQYIGKTRQDKETVPHTNDN